MCSQTTKKPRRHYFSNTLNIIGIKCVSHRETYGCIMWPRAWKIRWNDGELWLAFSTTFSGPDGFADGKMHAWISVFSRKYTGTEKNSLPQLKHTAQFEELERERFNGAMLSGQGLVRRSTRVWAQRTFVEKSAAAAEALRDHTHVSS